MEVSQRGVELLVDLVHRREGGHGAGHRITVVSLFNGMREISVYWLSCVFFSELFTYQGTKS